VKDSRRAAGFGLRGAGSRDSVVIGFGSGDLGDGLFSDLTDEAAPQRAKEAGRPRLREPVRDQIELRAVDLDSVIGADHPVRLFWAYVQGIDLRRLEAAIKSREGGAGHPAAAPRLLLALWLFATSEAIGSARALDELCRSHDAYRWLCGGVSLNYHTLSDFRVAHGALLDELLTQNVVALAAAGLIDLDGLSHDGMRVRAAAGASSFRRRNKLEEQLAQAGALVARLKAEVDGQPDISRTRAQAARQRAARERAERLAQALAKHAEIAALRAPKAKAERTRRAKPAAPASPAPAAEAAAAGAPPSAPAEPAEAPAESRRKLEPRVSTTDPEARIIKMPDGGFRPGYNAQVTTAAGSQIIVGVEVVTSSSDAGLLKPVLQQIEARYGRLPADCLADGGFNKNDDIEWAAGRDVAVHCPPVKNKHKTDPFAPREDDGPGVAAWRMRMASEAGKARYKLRSITECVHGRMRQNDLYQITVRGLARAKSILLLHALANNILQGDRLVREAARQSCAAA
jgi:transposase